MFQKLALFQKSSFKISPGIYGFHDCLSSAVGQVLRCVQNYALTSKVTDNKVQQGISSCRKLHKASYFQIKNILMIKLRRGCQYT